MCVCVCTCMSMHTRHVSIDTRDREYTAEESSQTMDLYSLVSLFSTPHFLSLTGYKDQWACAFTQQHKQPQVPGDGGPGA